ncbi:MAG: signal recognition particle-docking protein FtsY [Burkholderiales bacterium]
MFDFFKRKPAPDADAPAPAQAESSAPDDAPASAPAAPEAVTPAPETPAPAAEAPPEKRSWTERLKAGLGLSRAKLGSALTGVFSRKKLDDQALEELEDALLTGDVGVDAAQHLIEDLKSRWRKAGDDADPRRELAAAMADLIAPLEKPLVIGSERPFVIMLAGVNGAGKTTSIGKLAKWLQSQNLSVLLAAGDTFRAAAREQLAVWGQRNNVAVIQQSGGDAASVMFDAVEAARARGIDVVLADTAGRLPTQSHLMEELRKVKRVLGRALPGAPHEILLVLDANTGQNGLAQVKAFDAAVGLTGLVVTKLDGSAKGGVVAAIAKQHPVPLRFIGVGEGVDDLRPFVAREFVDALLGVDD